MAHARLQRAGGPCRRRLCRALGSFGGRQACAAFYHPDRDLRCVVNRDDFSFTGYDPDLDWAEKVMTESFRCKVEGGWAVTLAT
eukprot:11887782-Alexandrium_andersonii.AAC.1